MFHLLLHFVSHVTCHLYRFVEVNEFDTFLKNVEDLIRAHRLYIEGLEKEKVEKFNSQNSEESSDKKHIKEKGYYFFTSDGKKIPNKWDTFDVDAAEKELDDQVSSSEADVAPPNLNSRDNNAFRKEEYKEFIRKCQEVKIEEEKLFQHLDKPMMEKIISKLEDVIVSELKMRKKKCIKDVNGECPVLEVYHICAFQ